jgi:hypothetical protein
MAQALSTDKFYKYNSMQTLVHRDCHYLPKPYMGAHALSVWASNMFTDNVCLEKYFRLVVQFTSTLSSDQFTLANVYGRCDAIARENFKG